MYATRRQPVLRRVGSPVQTLPKVIVAEGDSLTAPNNSYASLWAAENPTIPFTNKAVGGAIIGTAALQASRTGRHYRFSLSTTAFISARS